jgi:hypothetical protein
MNLNNMIFDIMPEKNAPIGNLKLRQESGIFGPKFHDVLDDSISSNKTVAKDILKNGSAGSKIEQIDKEALLEEDVCEEIPSKENEPYEKISEIAELLLLNPESIQQEDAPINPENQQQGYMDLIAKISALPLSETQKSIEDLIGDFVLKIKESFEKAENNTVPNNGLEDLHIGSVKKVIRQAVIKIFQSIHQDAKIAGMDNPLSEKIQNMAKPFTRILEPVLKELLESLDFEELSMDIQNIKNTVMQFTGPKKQKANPEGKEVLDHSVIGTIKSLSARIANSFAEVINDAKEMQESLLITAEGIALQGNKGPAVSAETKSSENLKSFGLKHLTSDPAEGQNRQITVLSDENRIMHAQFFKVEDNHAIDMKNVVLQVIKNIDPSLNKQNEEVIIKLEPESLGMIRIRVLSVEGKVEVEIKTQYGFTKQLLGDAIADLKKNLEGKGFDIGEMIISADPQSFKNQKEKAASPGAGKNINSRFFRKEMEEPLSAAQTRKGIYYDSQYNIDILA